MNRTGLLTRRSFVSGLLASAAHPVWAKILPTNPDVVIIGAVSPDYPALCSGAFITGETAAREVIATSS
jgi:hypothetical protein